MKLLFLIFVSMITSGNTVVNPHNNSVNAKVKKLKIFVLKDSGKNKYYVSEKVKTFYKKGYIEKSPLIAIDGIVLEYDINLDTILLPLKKNKIAVVSCVNKSSSEIIYGTKGTGGAIVINTNKLKYAQDTIKTNPG